MATKREKSYGQQVTEAIAEGNAAGEALRKRREAVGAKGNKGVYGQMPKILHEQLIDRYGTECFADDGFMRDLKRLHPEMMNATGEDVSGDNIIGTANRFGRVSYKRLPGGKWVHWNGKSWEAKEPPSKMKWGQDDAPAIL